MCACSMSVHGFVPSGENADTTQRTCTVYAKAYEHTLTNTSTITHAYTRVFIIHTDTYTHIQARPPTHPPTSHPQQPTSHPSATSHHPLGMWRALALSRRTSCSRPDGVCLMTSLSRVLLVMLSATCIGIRVVGGRLRATVPPAEGSIGRAGSAGRSQRTSVGVDAGGRRPMPGGSFESVRFLRRPCVRVQQLTVQHCVITFKVFRVSVHCTRSCYSISFTILCPGRFVRPISCFPHAM